MMIATAEEIIRFLDLQPLPGEGGFYAETYRSERALSAQVLPERYGGARALGTAIYYLLTPDTWSALHRLKGDEIYHFYLGDPVEMLNLHWDGTGEVVVLGNDLTGGQTPQHVVPGGTWQGSRLLPGGTFALMGTTMSPGFDFEDCESGKGDALRGAFPSFSDLIGILAPRSQMP